MAKPWLILFCVRTRIGLFRRSITAYCACVTGEKKMLIVVCPGWGSNPQPSAQNSTLYRVAIKAGLYRKAVKVCYIHNTTTYSPSIFRFVPESQFELPRTYIRHGCASSPSDWLFTLGARWKKMLITFCPSWGSNPRPSAQKSNTLPRRYKRRLVPQGSKSVYYT